MTPSDSEKQGFIARHRFKLEALALAAILGLPFALYYAAQAGLALATGLLLGAMALVMLAVIGLS